MLVCPSVCYVRMRSETQVRKKALVAEFHWLNHHHTLNKTSAPSSILKNYAEFLTKKVAQKEDRQMQMFFSLSYKMEAAITCQTPIVMARTAT